MSFFDPAATDPWPLRLAADTVLALHIGGGSPGMASGFLALVAPKGGRLHSVVGTTFFIAMLTMATIGAGYPAVAAALGAAPLLVEAPNMIAGVMTLYLIATSWAAVRRKTVGVRAVDLAGLCVALAVAVAGVCFIVLATRSNTGTVGTTPPQAFYVFTLVGTIAVASDLKVIAARGIAGAGRIARHLWRMCVALTIATGSFFLGQQQVMPKVMQGSPYLYLPVFAPLVLMVFWLIWVRLKRWRAAGNVGRGGVLTRRPRRNAVNQDDRNPTLA